MESSLTIHHALPGSGRAMAGWEQVKILENFQNGPRASSVGDFRQRKRSNFLGPWTCDAISRLPSWIMPGAVIAFCQIPIHIPKFKLIHRRNSQGFRDRHETHSSTIVPVDKRHRPRRVRSISNIIPSTLEAACVI